MEGQVEVLGGAIVNFCEGYNETLKIDVKARNREARRCEKAEENLDHIAEWYRRSSLLMEET